MFEAVIFDWDGTLADTRAVLVTAFKRALYTIGLVVEDELIERRIGIGVVATFRGILDYKGVSYDDDLIQRMLKIKVETEISLSTQIRLFTGARELLNSLDGKITVALASMNQREFIDHALKEKDLQKFFSVTLTANEVRNPKPDPEIFLKTALKLGVKPERCLVVEDSIFGVKAAKTANMSCVAVAQGAYSKEELTSAKPDLIVGSLLEKNAILNMIFG